MVCTWHLPVRGKVEKRKHMERASSRSRRASMNVGYLRGQKESTYRFSHGPPWRSHSPSQAVSLPPPDHKARQCQLPHSPGRNHGTRTCPLSSEKPRNPAESEIPTANQGPGLNPLPHIVVREGRLSRWLSLSFKVEPSDERKSVWRSKTESRKM